MTAGDGGGDDILVREAVEEDEPELLRLLTTSLAGGPTGERTADFLRWKHRRSVFGESPGLVALSGDGRLVGVRLFLRWEFTAGGSVVRAARPVDTATHPDFRGRGIFRRLTLDLLERVSRDTHLVFNTPNANSLPGYLSMGWRRVGTVPIAVRPARPGSFVRGLGGELSRLRGGPPKPAPGTGGARLPVRCPLPTAAEVLKGVSGLDALLEERAAADAAAPRVRLGTERTAEFLRWRYADAPGLDYRAIAVEHGGTLAGIAFCRPRARGRLAELTLSDLVVRPGDRATAARLLRTAASAGCDHVATHLADGTEGRSVALRSGYLPAPRTGMTLVARPFGERVPGSSEPDPLESASWRFALGDLEVF